MMAEGHTIETADLRFEGRERAPLGALTRRSCSLATCRRPTCRAFKVREKERILAALDQHAWNRAKAATALGMPRRTFYRRLSEFGIL